MDIWNICYGRDDLLKVAEKMATEMGDINISEDLVNEMATAAFKLLTKIDNGGTYSITNY